MSRSILVLLLLGSFPACAADDGTPSADTTGVTTSSSSSSSSSSSGSSADDIAPASTSTTSSGSDGGSSGVADGTSDDAGSSSGGVAGIEIAGDWTDDFGGGHQISDGAWIDVYGEDMFPYTIDHYDNADDVAIAQDDGDGTWSKFEWIIDGEMVWYCQSAYGMDSAAAAEAAPDADPAAPDTGGCGGFAWSALHPA